MLNVNLDVKTNVATQIVYSQPDQPSECPVTNIKPEITNITNMSPTIRGGALIRPTLRFRLL